MRSIALLLLIPLLLTACSAAADVPDPGLKLAQHLGKDPVVAAVSRDFSPVELYDGWMSMIEKFAGVDAAVVTGGLSDFEAKIGCSIRDDLLANVGPHVGFVADIPGIEPLMMMASDPAALLRSLDRIGIVATLRDPDRVAACLEGLFSQEGASRTVEDGLHHVRFGGAQGPDGPGLYYGFRDDLWALGVSPDFVRRTLSPLPAGERLTDGADLAALLPYVDESPSTLFYVNLPRVRRLIDASPMLQGMIGSEPAAQGAIDLFLPPEASKRGMVIARTKLDGAVRQVSYGAPSIFSGSLTSSMIAAVAIPNLLNATDRGKQKRAMADMRSAAVACESFAIDHNRYPGPTDGWVPLVSIAQDLQPTYVSQLPVTDAWGNELLYWSDGESYRIVSPGKDGRTSQDWADTAAGRQTHEFAADIVLADGTFVQWPEGSQQ